MIIFEKNYDGESLYDFMRDMSEAFDSRYNPIVEEIPKDDYNISQGTFKVKIEWEVDE